MRPHASHCPFTHCPRLGREGEGGGFVIDSSDLENQGSESHDLSVSPRILYREFSECRKEAPTLVLLSQTLSMLCKQEIPVSTETPEEGQVGLGLRVPETGPEGWGGAGRDPRSQCQPSACTETGCFWVHFTDAVTWKGSFWAQLSILGTGYLLPSQLWS